jgi:hypothetical protein
LLEIRIAVPYLLYLTKSINIRITGYRGFVNLPGGCAVQLWRWGSERLRRPENFLAGVDNEAANTSQKLG